MTLANPFGPPRLGRAEVEKTVEAAAANFKGGSMRFEEISRFATPDLGYAVWLERADVQLVGSEDLQPSSLRVTMIFRREGNTWKVARRHADPITTARPDHHDPRHLNHAAETGTGAVTGGGGRKAGVMKIGVVYPQIELRGDPEAVRRFGLAAEELGYDHLLAYDHVVGADTTGSPSCGGPTPRSTRSTTRS